MALSRRTFGSIALRVMGFLSLTAFFEETSGACIYGKWLLVCPRFPKQHADFVDDGTCQHPCNSCRSQMFNGNVVTVRCRNGHDSVLTSGPGTKNGITQHATCATCHIDCRWG